MTVVLFVVLGIVYPLVMVGLGELIFPWQAHGSLVVRDGHVVGSELIGQNFSGAGYFHPRPSAAGDKGYDASGSSGSNLAPSNKQLIDAVKTRLGTVLEENPGVTANQIPPDMVTTSGSGLDPEITQADAELQVPRVAKARGLSEEQVKALIASNTRPPSAGLFGEPGVNVLTLNLALDVSAKQTAGNESHSPYKGR